MSTAADTPSCCWWWWKASIGHPVSPGSLPSSSTILPKLFTGNLHTPETFRHLPACHSEIVLYWYWFVCVCVFLSCWGGVEPCWLQCIPWLPVEPWTAAYRSVHWCISLGAACNTHHTHIHTETHKHICNNVYAFTQTTMWNVYLCLSLPLSQVVISDRLPLSAGDCGRITDIKRTKRAEQKMNGSGQALRDNRSGIRVYKEYKQWEQAAGSSNT